MASKFDQRLSAAGFTSYREYLESPQWKQKRRDWYASKQNRKPGYCLFCNEKKPLDLHHKSYTRLCNERLDDLEAMCRDCHAELHRLAAMKPHKPYHQRLSSARKQMLKKATEDGTLVFKNGNDVASVRQATGNPNWPKKKRKRRKKKKL